MLTFITTLLLSAFKIFSDGLLETSIWTAINSAKYVTLWHLGLHPQNLAYIAISFKLICSKTTQKVHKIRLGGNSKFSGCGNLLVSGRRSTPRWPGRKINLHIISACLHKISFSRHDVGCTSAGYFRIKHVVQPSNIQKPERRK